MEKITQLIVEFSKKYLDKFGLKRENRFLSKTLAERKRTESQKYRVIFAAEEARSSRAHQNCTYTPFE